MKSYGKKNNKFDVEDIFHPQIAKGNNFQTKSNVLGGRMKYMLDTFFSLYKAEVSDQIWNILKHSLLLCGY